MGDVQGSGRLTNKTALVTGGGSGIGLAMVRRFVSEGARVVVGDLDDARLTLLRDEFGPCIHTVHTHGNVGAKRNGGTRITKPLFDNLLRWKAE